MHWPHRSWFPRALEIVGLAVIVGATLFLTLSATAQIPLALGLIAFGFALWAGAWAFPGSREGEQPWARSPQVAFLVLALSQVSTVALNRRAQDAAERRIGAERASSAAREVRNDSLALARERRQDSLAWVRVLRGDSLVISREARIASEQRLRAERQRVAQEAATRRRVAEFDREIMQRLATLRDSLDSIGSLIPTTSHRESYFYSRTSSAFERFLAPRHAFANDLGSNTTYQILTARQGMDPQPDVAKVIMYVQSVTSSPDGVRFNGARQSWTNPDTLSVDLSEPFTHSTVTYPLWALVDALSIPRWRR